MPMAFMHKGWNLYTRSVTLNGGREQQIFFFSKKTPASGRPVDAMPSGYRVMDTPNFPVLKKA